LKVADKVSISFQGEALTIECKGEIMRSTPDGFGVRFFSLSFAQKRDIRRILKTLFAVRYDVDLSGYWLLNGQRLTTKVVDISNTGCYLQADVSGIEKGAEGIFEVQNRRRRHLLPGAIVWVNSESSHEKPAGFGVHFAKSRRRVVKKIVAHYGTGKPVQ
jgi:Tfp pilus assembly protein PilZ